MMWKKKENKFLWSKESDKKSALYTNLCTTRLRDPLIDLQKKNDRIARVFCKKAEFERQETRLSNALGLYSQSLYFAESLEQLSYGYACRATCFFESKMFKECLIDLDLAKQHKFNDIEELEKRQETCIKIMNQGKQPDTFEPILSYPSKENFPGLAEVLKIEHNIESGLHITATADIAAGQTVLIENAFFTLSIGSEQRCSKCFASYSNLIPCKNCTRALFCVDSCESCDIHRLECGMQFPKIQSLIKEDFVPVTRSLVVALNIFGGVNELKEFVENIIASDQMQLPTETKCKKSQYAIFLRHFDKNHPNASNTSKANIQIIYHAIMNHRPLAEKFITKHHQRFLMHLIGHHISIRRKIANGVEFRNKLVIPILGSYFNHSCIPNAIMLPIDGRIVTTTCRPIKSGEQIFISYHGTRFQSPFIERQRIIEHEFHFKCRCERCSMEVTDTLIPHRFLDDETRKMIKNSAEALLYTIEKRKLVTEICIKNLNEHGRVTWCEDLAILLSNYFVLLHTKFLLKTTH